MTPTQALRELELIAACVQPGRIDDPDLDLLWATSQLARIYAIFWTCDCPPIAQVGSELVKAIWLRHAKRQGT